MAETKVVMMVEGARKDPGTEVVMQEPRGQPGQVETLLTTPGGQLTETWPMKVEPQMQTESRWDQVTTMVQEAEPQ